ncbi:TPA: hypothetical protein TX081_000870 [Streptococcus suis]|nr:hypothetical protein [Streptococcus suis]
MELVMPNNYVVLEEEEMMYLGGGWSASVLGNNLWGAAKKFAVVFSVVNAMAKSLGYVNAGALAALKGSFSFIVGKISWAIGKFVGIIGGFWTGFLAGFSAGAALTYLGNNRVFY